MTTTQTHGSQCPSDSLAALYTRDVLPHKDALARRARRLTRNEADAEDLLQDALLNAYRSFHTFQQGTNVRAWLFTILYNGWVSDHRRSRRRLHAEFAVEQFTDRQLAPVATRSAEAQVLDALPDDALAAALATLPVGFVEVFYLVVVQGHSYVETAALLKIPVGTVMSRCSRSRKRLRAAMTDHLAVPVV